MLSAIIMIWFLYSTSLSEKSLVLIVGYGVMIVLLVERLISPGGGYTVFGVDLIAAVFAGYIMIALTGGAWSYKAYGINDDTVRTKGSVVCTDRCYQGAIIASTSSRVAIRYWNDTRVHYYPIGEIKSYIGPGPLVEAIPEPANR